MVRKFAHLDGSPGGAPVVVKGSDQVATREDDLWELLDALTPDSKGFGTPFARHVAGDDDDVLGGADVVADAISLG